MKVRTKAQYIERLSRMNRNLYSNGEKIDRLDERQQGAISVMGLTYEAAHDPESRDLCTAVSHLNGEVINRFNHIHQNPDDLHKKQDMTRYLCNKVVHRCDRRDYLEVSKSGVSKRELAAGGAPADAFA